MEILNNTCQLGLIAIMVKRHFSITPYYLATPYYYFTDYQLLIIVNLFYL